MRFNFRRGLNRIAVVLYIIYLIAALLLVRHIRNEWRSNVTHFDAEAHRYLDESFDDIALGRGEEANKSNIELSKSMRELADSYRRDLSEELTPRAALREWKALLTYFVLGPLLVYAVLAAIVEGLAWIGRGFIRPS